MWSPHEDVATGARDALPILVVAVAFGLAVGAASGAAGLSVLQAGVFSLLVNAGASQLAAIALAQSGALPTVVVLTALAINARMLVYSAALVPYYRDEPFRWRAVVAFLVIDPLYAIASIRFQGDPSVDRLRYYLGAGVPILAVWVAATVVGTAAGYVVPGWLPLDFAVPMVFLALVAGAIDDRPAGVAAVVGGVVSVAAAGVPFRVGILLGAVCGIAAGLLADRGVGG